MVENFFFRWQRSESRNSTHGGYSRRRLRDSSSSSSTYSGVIFVELLPLEDSEVALLEKPVNLLTALTTLAARKNWNGSSSTSITPAVVGRPAVESSARRRGFLLLRLVTTAEPGLQNTAMLQWKLGGHRHASVCHRE
jgi:hypothetical protein